MGTVAEYFFFPKIVHGHNGITTANNGQFQLRSVVISVVVVLSFRFLCIYSYWTAFCVLISIYEMMWLPSHLSPLCSRPIPVRIEKGSMRKNDNWKRARVCVYVREREKERRDNPVTNKKKSNLVPLNGTTSNGNKVKLTFISSSLSSAFSQANLCLRHRRKLCTVHTPKWRKFFTRAYRNVFGSVVAANSMSEKLKSH